MRFTEEEIRFLVKELGYERETVDRDLSDLEEDLLYEIADRSFDVELEGDISDSDKVPNKCKVAADIFTMLNS